ncbi:MAG TPA: AbiV family abortive infection protein [Anaerolineales bacterium]|nr:AbiV family abortive infection protein [Anaerolineales bacterium]
MTRPLSKIERQILPHLNREVVLKFTAYTIINISDLRDAARQLIQNERYGLARSMAIFTQEEFGKLMLCIMYLTQQIEPERFLRKIRSHPDKQALGILLTQITPHLDSSLQAAFAQNPNSISAALESISKDEDSLATLIEQNIHPEIDSLVHNYQTTLQGSEEEIRQQGIYVSISFKQQTLAISHPRQTTREEAEAAMKTIDGFMNLVDQSGALWQMPENDIEDDSELPIDVIVKMLEEMLKHK